MIFKRILFLIVLTISFYSCINSVDGDGNIASEERNVESFSKIDISGEFEIMLNQGKTEKVEIEADENLLELISTETKNETLIIKTTEDIGSTKSLKIYITVVNLEDIDVSGAVTLKTKGKLVVDELGIDVSGAADINIDIETETLSMDMSGASETSLKGEADHFDIELSGASELEADKLKTKHTKIDISGAGAATVYAKKTLAVEISGAGSVKYKGKPKITKDISGAGSIKKL